MYTELFQKLISLLFITFAFFGCQSKLTYKIEDENVFKISLDTKSASAVLNLIDGNAQIKDVGSLPGVKALVIRNKKDDSSLTINKYLELAKRCHLKACKDSSATNFVKVKRNIKVIKQFIEYLEDNRSAIEQESTRVVRGNIPGKPISFDYPVYFVVGGLNDAFVEDIDGKQHMVVDLGRMVDNDLEAAKENIFAFANHEIWHAAYFEYIDKYWDKKIIPYTKATEGNDDYELIFSMLDEGYGHYLSFLGWYPDKKEALKRLKEKAFKNNSNVGYLSLFQTQSKKYINSSLLKEKKRLLKESQIGDFYKKWGALTGALVVATLDNKIGRQKLIKSIESDPFKIWGLYQENVDIKYKLNDDFIRFTDKTKASMK